jgi:23S rRNA maturation mini-RNase III
MLRRTRSPQKLKKFVKKKKQILLSDKIKKTIKEEYRTKIRRSKNKKGLRKFLKIASFTTVAK